MTAGERDAAVQRARDLFGWEPQKPSLRPAPAMRAPQTAGPLELAVGVFVDGGTLRARCRCSTVSPDYAATRASSA
jgi:hypothetical protein